MNRRGFLGRLLASVAALVAGRKVVEAVTPEPKLYTLTKGPNRWSVPVSYLDSIATTTNPAWGADYGKAGERLSAGSLARMIEAVRTCNGQCS